MRVCACVCIFLVNLSLFSCLHSSCRSPQSVSNRSIVSLPASELTCTGSFGLSRVHKILVVVSMSAIMIVTATILVIRRRRRAMSGDGRCQVEYNSLYHVTQNECSVEDDGENVCFLRGNGKRKKKSAPVNV